MKNLIRIFVVTLSFAIAQPGNAQLGVLRKAKEKVEKRTEEAVDKKLDEVLGTSSEQDAAKPGAETAGTPAGSVGAPAAGDAADMEPAAKTGMLNWSKYDFVPGDKVIFEDDLREEENGEFPSRWDLSHGVAEVAELDGDKVIMLRGGQPTIVPYLENSDQDYLPDVFTVEFDVYMGGTGGWADLYLWDNKNQERGPGNQATLDIRHNELSISGSTSNYPGEVKRNRWIHIAVAYTEGQFKAYMDDTRLINIPRLDFNPQGISLYSYHASDNNPIFLKNIRIAEGGVKYYDRVMQDGKIVANGIRFDVGKATLLPESMGIINEVVQLMKDHPDLAFSVEGHTDSDGNDEMNLDLSTQRAETVRSTMVGMGIAEDRLSAKGLGETMPVSGNTTPEGKANNRRVEFVRL